MVFFTSDLHLGHDNIIRYCKRPFKDLDEMRAVIKKNWNKKVKPDDDVYILGDMVFFKNNKDISMIEEYIASLNGKKFLIKGNHDKHNIKQISHLFGWIRDYYKLSVYNQDIILLHYAMLVWDKSHHGAWHLYGHSHGTLPNDPNSLSMDVGVDANNFTPVSFDEVKAVMATKTFKPIDYHGTLTK